MAQETEPVAATAVDEASLEAPSPKRRNRKKGRRGSTAGGDDDDEQETAAAVSPCVSPVGDVATANLISLPSPVAQVPTADVFAETAAAMEQLALTQDTPRDVEGEEVMQVEQVKEDGLLKLPVHPSSGRLPLTPPPTPEPFTVHSPEKEQARVAPMSPEVQLLPTVAETPTDVELTVTEPVMQAEVDEAPTASTLEHIETNTTGVVETPTPAVEAAETIKSVEDVATEHDASVLTNSLSEMTFGNQSIPNKEPTDLDMVDEKGLKNVESASAIETTAIEAPANVAPFDVLSAVPSPMDGDDHVAALAADVKVISISSSSPADATLTETTVPQNQPATVVPVETPQAELSTTNEAKEVNLEPQQVQTIPPEAPSQPERPNKRKGGSPGKPHTTSAVTSKPAPNAHQNKAISSSTNSENARKSKQAASKSTPEAQPLPRPAKRKGGVADAIPPPAPVTEVVKETRPKRLVARSSSGSMLNTARAATEANLKSSVMMRPVQDSKKDSIMGPTASSMARATAAEARKAMVKSAAAKKAPLRKPVKTRLLAKTHEPLVLDQDNTTTALPAASLANDGDDSQRNVKRRLNATDVEAASKRLYEDAKEAKLRKDARRAELQETYTFAPQVNNFKRRTAPGETEESNQDHFTRLHAQAKELLERKRELQQQHERDGCTFAPAISARAKRLPQTSSGPRYENLYKHAQELKLKREKKLMEKAKTTEEQCPFKPKITVSKSPVKTKPLYDSEREKQKRLALEQKKIEAEMSECTFKPKVSAKRMKSKVDDASETRTDTHVDTNPYNRLYQASIDQAERLQKLRQERDEEEKAQAPFQPKITARSRLAKAKTKTTEPFHKRLYSKDYMKKLDAEREQRRLEEEQQFTFKRLYDEKDKVKEKIEMGQELKLQKEMAECTFRPQIEVNTVQGDGEPAPPVWERLLSYDKAQVIEEREKLKEQLEMQECTFKPEVKSPDALLMKRSPSFNVFDRLTSSGSNSPLDPTRGSFITRRPSSSPGRQSPDVRIGYLNE
ncbi:unnamed protein product [Phytophthora lilii]|uniref:Unnamed protein product n=1 Tax=Phytophthora lilii TaxID=2077276 RepID=A0A9W6YIX7_9STRA|nr:unnamed protein product [Phytophthora lilii]